MFREEVDSFIQSQRELAADNGDMATWAQRLFGKGEIDRAGDTLVPWWTSTEDMREASEERQEEIGHAWLVAQNWRASHALPLLAFRMGLTSRAKRFTPDVLIAQRLKRMTSMLNKLARQPKMKLSQMQDLGGCRAIVPDISSVERIFELYRGPDNLFGSEGSIKAYDYIKQPKEDGYRGVHIVGRYHAKAASNEHWNGHRIEIQIRTRLQHAFSTSVETVTTFTRHPLKFGGGPDEWRRFFALAGSAFALREQTPLVPGTPTNPNELIGELRDITKTLKVRQRLAAWARAIKKVPGRGVKGFEWLLLVLNVSDNTISVVGYPTRLKAAQALDLIERNKSEEVDAVLVWVNSVRNLKSAYPNYYADTGQFIDALNQSLRS
jgi:hypothetical protein